MLSNREAPSSLLEMPCAGVDCHFNYLNIEREQSADIAGDLILTPYVPFYHHTLQPALFNN